MIEPFFGAALEKTFMAARIDKIQNGIALPITTDHYIIKLGLTETEKLHRISHDSNIIDCSIFVSSSSAPSSTSSTSPL
jgi:hypothetical protein